ncbi:DUF4241 domain-containing protein [Streptomyces sp. NPDC060027]|uniref:DUF4241 domain-containing protein n=1 Tax=Streptomyces sp. NPDC060027 TaxID=3347040 RepID=UPI0036775A6E
MAEVEVSYAQAWDAEARRECRPLSMEEARRKDSDGRSYVVIHRAPGRATPLTVHLVSWGDHYVGQWTYDEVGRVTHEADLRLLEADRLFLRRHVERRYSSPDQQDRARDAWRLTLDLFPDGRGTKVLEERGDHGGSFRTRADVPESERWRPRSDFGVPAAGMPGVSAEPGPGARTAQDACGEGPEPQSLWKPPRPGRPALALNELLRPGRRFTSESWGEMTVEEIRHIATLRVPSGRLVVADPMDRDDSRQLTERIPPGEYPLQAAVLVGEGDYYGERFPVTEEPLVRLLIAADPAVTWEMGLGEGEDPRLLLDGHAYGFGTDAATGGFADASGWKVLSGKIRRYYDEGDESAAEFVTDGCLRATDEETGGDLVSFCTGGDGTWPVWLGRSATGELVAVAVITSFVDLRPV